MFPPTLMRVRAPGRSRTAAPVPTLDLERELLGDGVLRVAGMDEVGRGALAGPVSVGVVVVDATTVVCPPGVRDSKLLTPAARRRVVGPITSWCRSGAVGHASPQEIDDLGIIGALRAAGLRALAAVSAAVGQVDVVVLDGVHDWLSGEALTLFEEPATGMTAGLPVLGGPPRVVTRAKADRDCASVAAASVLAKCERDALMEAHAADHPGYGWERNKGYGSPAHREALRREGITPLHRRSWRLLP